MAANLLLIYVGVTFAMHAT